jgi:OOP family OmpA-OmpF porin
MHQPIKWWTGLVPLALVWIIGNWVRTDAIETDLADRAKAAIANISADVLDKPSLVVAGRDVTLSGTAFTPQGSTEADSAADATFGVRKVIDAIGTVSAASPYIFSAVHDAGKVTLTGDTPSPAMRAKTVAAAKAALPGTEVTDDLNYASGVPAGDYAGATAFALAELGKLTGGKTTLRDAGYSITGIGKENVTNSSVAADAKTALPQGFSVVLIDITSAVVSPYVFNAATIGGKLTLTGYYPDEQAHQAILAAASSKFPGVAIDDQLKLAGGAPDAFVSAVADGLGEMSQLTNGKLALSGATALLIGETDLEKTANDIKAAFAGSLPTTFRGRSDISFKSAPPPSTGPLQAADCQTELTATLSKGKIQFETDSANLTKDALPVLANIVAVAKRCSSGAIEVAGYTDSTGAAPHNIILSKARAQTVVDYLVKNGINAARISAVGYGETRPIAANDNEAGKAQNRRIEFTVK